MTDLVIKVRLDGDGGGLVGQLNGVAAAEAEVANEAKGMAGAAGTATLATDKQAAAASRLAKSETEAATALAKAAKAENDLALSAMRLEQAHGRAAKSVQGLQKSASATGSGLQGLSMQFGDFTQQLALGTPFFMAFGQQAGQAAFAMQTMGGVAGRVGAFFSGPWGAAILAGTVVLGPYISKLLSAGDALKEVEFSTYALRDAQSILGGVMDIATGKINNQSAALMALARAQAIAGQVKARQQIADAREAQASLTPGVLGRAFSPKGDSGQMRGDILSAYREGSLTGPEAERALRSGLKAGLISQQSYLDAAKAITDELLGRENLKVFESTERMLTGQGTAADRSLLLKPDKPKKGTDEAKRLAEWAEKAEERITRISEQFGEQPKLVQRVNAATRELDRIIGDLNEKQPKGFKDMIAEAQKAKGVVQEALLRPFNDYLEKQDQSRQVQELILAGREDEARALQQIFQLADQTGQVTKDQRAAILANVEAERKLNEQLEHRQKLVDAYSSAIGGVRGDLERLLGNQISGGDFLKSIKSNLQQLQGRILTEQIFGPALRDLEKYVQEKTGIQSSVDIMKAGTEKAGKAASGVGDAFDRLEKRTDAIFSNGGTGGGTSPSNETITGVGAALAGWGALFRSTTADNLPGSGDSDSDNGEIVVTAKKLQRSIATVSPMDFSKMLAGSMTSPLLNKLDMLLGTNFFSRLNGALSGALGGYMTGGATGGVLGGLKGIVDTFGSGAFAKDLSKTLGKALGGAQTGTQIAGIGKALGIKTSTTGAQIGGAIGAALPIPGGDIIGSILGGLVGGLFKKTKTGTATIGSLDGVLGVTGTGGNSASRKKAASDLAGSVLGIVDNIAQQLGASIDPSRGAVSIGIRDKKYRVDYSGGGATKTSKGAVDFGKDGAEAAVAAAAANLIADGVVVGLSAAVTKALKSNADLDKAMAEAVKTKELEKLLGGFSGAALDAFRNFEIQAKDRLRIANAYGLELNKVEELNAKDRIKLREQLEAESFGSLQDLLDRMKNGDLFEGSAVDQLASIKAEIAKVRPQAEAGEEGAADKLASLLEQQNSLAKDVFGTAGGYSQERSAVQATAESVIGLLRGKLDEAAAQANPQIDQTNALMDENNDQNSKVITELQRIYAALAAGQSLTPQDAQTLAAQTYTGGAGGFGVSLPYF